MIFFEDDNDLDDMAMVFDRMEEGINKRPKHEGYLSRRVRSIGDRVADQNCLVCGYIGKDPL